MIEYFTKVVSVGNGMVFPDIQFFREWLAEEAGEPCADILDWKLVGEAGNAVILEVSGKVDREEEAANNRLLARLSSLGRVNDAT
jgi:hypothetical protein